MKEFTLPTIWQCENLVSEGEVLWCLMTPMSKKKRGWTTGIRIEYKQYPTVLALIANSERHYHSYFDPPPPHAYHPATSFTHPGHWMWRGSELSVLSTSLSIYVVIYFGPGYGPIDLGVPRWKEQKPRCPSSLDISMSKKYWYLLSNYRSPSPSWRAALGGLFFFARRAFMLWSINLLGGDQIPHQRWVLPTA